MKLICIAKGFFAEVDDEDYALLSRFSWHLKTDKPNYYAACNIAGRTVRMHQIILGGLARRVDHIDGNGLNNQKLNLRPCTHLQNTWNRKVQKHSSKYKGVTFVKSTGKWMASIRLDGKKRHLGYFDKEIDAARAYDFAAGTNFGTFARTNKMEGLLN